MKRETQSNGGVFSRYQVFAIALLAVIQFTVVLDFMVLSPLGAVLLKELSITTEQFGHVVSAYAFSAGVSALLAAAFADKFDRKRMLLFFYGGFILGTLFCGLAPNYHMLLLARVLTGFFGGVMSSIGFAIVTDLFPLGKRGRVMGFVQMAFSASQILGMPFGLYLATRYGWHSPFLCIVGLSALTAVTIVFRMRPIDAHLKIPEKRHPFRKLAQTLGNRRYLQGFATVTLLSAGGYMIMPFASAFTVENVGIDVDHLPLVYMIAGLCTLMTGPIAGRLSDTIGKFRVFLVGSLLAMTFILIFTHLGPTPLWQVMVLNAFLYIGVSTRMIAAQALLTAVPLPQDRGTYMSINSSIQQASGGFAALIAGLIVVQQTNGTLLHYGTLGYLVAGIMIATILLVFNINRVVRGDAVVAASSTGEQEAAAAAN